MRLGFNIPQLGRAASGEAMVKVARHAEGLGFDTVWVTERVLYPINPRTPYGATPDGSLPEGYKIVFDPIEALTWVAAQTSRIRLGTSVLDIPFYNPVMLARRLSTLDVLSGGRLTVGLGLGWSEDEYEATGAATKAKGKRADEFLQVLHAIWKGDPVEFHGQYYNVAKSIVNPKPVQKPHPPIYLAAFSPGAFSRIARLADGWNPVGMPVAAMRGMWENIRNMAKEAGRNPDDLNMIVRCNLNITQDPAPEGRWMFSGSLDQIRGDIAALRELNPQEIFFDPSFSPGVNTADDFIEVMELMRDAAG
jgi:probable F420-dependent oxidoreductase